jgi:hypothetical protein
VPLEIACVQLDWLAGKERLLAFAAAWVGAEGSRGQAIDRITTPADDVHSIHVLCFA